MRTEPKVASRCAIGSSVVCSLDTHNANSCTMRRCTFLAKPVSQADLLRTLESLGLA